MKKFVILFVFVLIFSSCKKDQIQPTWWDSLWYKPMTVMGDLNTTHKNILKKIEDIRTTLDEYVVWDQDTIQIWGPGGYEATANKAWRVWLDVYHTKLMPDTLNPPTTGELARIIKKYLDLRREYERTKAFQKMRLAIPKELYEQDSHFWEWWLTEVQSYLTVVLGGPDAWTDGTRQMHLEMEIYHLPTAEDPNDPWGHNCSAQTRITCWYKGYAEGPKNKSMSTEEWQKLDPMVRAQKTNDMMREKYPNHDKNMKLVREVEGQKRYENLITCPEEGFPIGNPQDYETKLGTVNGVEMYYIEIPCVPTR